MKAEKLLDAMGLIGDDLIAEAKEYKKKNKSKVIKMWISAVAAILVVAFVGGSIINPIFFKVNAISEAKYPDCAPYPVDVSSQDEYKEVYDLWKEDHDKRKASFDGDFENLKEFFTLSAEEFLTSSEGENTVISPLSMYISLGIVAEITQGTSRHQILELLNTDSIEDLRQQMLSIFNYHYCNDGRVESVVHNSLWLDDELQYNQSAFDELAEIYYTSSYYGKMGSNAYNKKLREWINEHTNNFLKDKNVNIKMSKDTVLNLATTISFSAQWLDMFLPEDGFDGDFYTRKGAVNTSYCGQSLYRNFYTSDDFSAVRQEMTDGYGMWLIRPNDDTDAESLLDDDLTMKFIMSMGKNANKQKRVVNLALPVFDAYSEIDLSDGYKNIGLTDVFDCELSDFSPVISNENVNLSSIQHNVRVKIDDNAENADDYTVSTEDNPDSENEVDLILNKPFIFAVTSDVGVPLLVGIVNQPL